VTSVSSKPSTACQAESSKISDTTNPQDKGNNLAVIEWFRSRPASAPYLMADGRVWTYREAVGEVERRLSSQPVVVRPSMTPGSVFDILAGISGGGATVSPATDGGEAPRTPPGTRLVVYTSGTTGSPKGARFTLANLEAASRASVEHLGHGPEDTWLLTLPLHHVGGLSILVRSAYAGGAVLLHPRFDPGGAAAALDGEVTMASLVPTMLTRILDHRPGPYRGLRAILIGGGPIPDGLLERAAGAGIPALPSYGMTETLGQVATLRPGSAPARRAHPLPGVEIRIEDDGRIAVCADQVSPGYLGEPDRADRWLVTNDLGSIDEEGALSVHGRADDVIVSGGVNVDPVAVETVLAGHPGVGEVVVVGVADAEWGEALVCLYTGSVDRVEVEEWARRELPGHLVPKGWLRVEALPRTSLGKPDRPAASGVYLSSTGSEPRPGTLGP
jgi:O-succinylbenzoic acid--CoA ligase